MLHRLRAALIGRHGPIWFGLMAFLLSLPSLRLGLQADDHLFVADTLHGSVPDWQLFSLPPAEKAEMRSNGSFAWWSSPSLSMQFLRPLSSLTHAFEFRHYLSSPHWMLLANALLYAVCVTLATALYRRLSPNVPVALLATWMFTIDDGHAPIVSWVSARNALLCATFSFAALLAQIEARATRRHWLQAASTLCSALALASGESGVWALALLIAYAYSFEPYSIAARMRTLWPQLLVGTAWAAMYLGGGYGVRGSALYRELSQPLSILLQGTADLPLWITTSFGPSIVSLFAIWPASTGRLITLPFALLCLWLLWPSLDRTPQCRFFGLCALLTLAPLLTTIPQDRLTLGIGFGTFGWLACFLNEARETTSRALRYTRHALFGLHAIVPLALFPALLGSSSYPIERAIQALLPFQANAQQVVLLNAPFEVLPQYTRSLDDSPRSFHALYAGSSSLHVKRTAPNALEVSPADGWGNAPIERVFCARRDLPQTGDVIELRDLQVEVLSSTKDKRPASVRFTFPTPLEAEGRTWLLWQGQKPTRWSPPALHAEIQIPGQLVISALPR